ncbi:MAG: tetratricopeptide repeat protein [Xanthomonadales bacterium]|nr:tetratricopeptide repeat protein [Xanthomonadales bacterium]
MRTVTIPRPLPLLPAYRRQLPLILVLVVALSACAGGATRPEATTGSSLPDGDDWRLSIPEQTLDMLPLDHLLAAEFALREDNLERAAQAYLEAALASERIEVARRATRVNLAAQRWQDAATALQRWQELAGPGSPELQQAHAALALGEGDADAATSHLLTLVQPGGVVAARLAAAALESAPDRALALAVLQRLADSPQLPADAAVVIGLSQAGLTMERNDLAEALAGLGTTRLPESPEVWFWRARLANAAGDPQRARQVLDQALQLNPDSPEIRRTYAVLLKNEFDDARGAALALADLPAEDDSLALRAAYALEAGDWDQVSEVQQALQSLDPPHPANRLLLMAGVAEAVAEHVADQDPAQAARWRAEAVDWYDRVDPEDGERHVRAQQRLAVLDQRDGRLDDARARLARIRATADADDPAFGDSYLLEAELLERAGHADDAIAVLSEGLEALPADIRLRYSRALAYERQDKVEPALADLRSLVELDPDNPMFLNAYGYTLADRTDRHEEALLLIQRALEADPEDIATIDSMGWVLYRLGRNEEALRYLQVAFASQPDAEIGAHLGEVLWVLGDREQARVVWRQAADSDPDNRVLKATLERFGVEQP